MRALLVTITVLALAAAVTLYVTKNEQALGIADLEPSPETMAPAGAPDDTSLIAAEATQREVVRTAESDGDAGARSNSQGASTSELPSTIGNEEFAYVLVRPVTPEGRPIAEAEKETGSQSISHMIWIWAGAEAPEVGAEFVPQSKRTLFMAQRPLTQQDQNVRRVRVPLPRELLYLFAVYNDKIIAVEPLPKDVTEIRLVIDLLELQVSSASLRARFVSRSGEPIAGAGRLQSIGSRIGINQGISIGPDGVMELQGLVPGRFLFKADFKGYARMEQSLELLPGEDRDLGTIALEAPTSITGRLVGAPESLVGREVQLHRPDEESAFKVETTDAEGGFRFQELPPGNYRLRVRFEPGLPSDGENRTGRRIATPQDAGQVAPPPTLSDWAYADTSSGDVEGVQLVLEEPFELTLRAVFSEGAAIDCTLHSAQGAVIDRCQLAAIDGRALFFLAPGTYEVRWSRAGVELGRRPVIATKGTQWVELLEGE